MPSRFFVAMEATLADLKAALIATGKDYGAYTKEEHDRALGFRVLASAHLEDYAERRCKEVAAAGAARLRSGQPTRTGHALLTWYIAKDRRAAIPLDDAERPPDLMLAQAVAAYTDSTEKSHGIAGRKLKLLVIPLGVRDADLDDQLFDLLDALATERGAAAHARVNRARQMVVPEKEWQDVQQLLPLLRDLDNALEQALTTR